MAYTMERVSVGGSRAFRRVAVEVSMSIVATGSLETFFNDLVSESIKSKGVSASGGASAYLVALLSDFSRPDKGSEEALHRPLAFLLDEALTEPDLGLRFDKLRALGDGVLYTSGFFGGRFEKRGVDRRYVFGVGTRAYGTVSSMLRSGSSTSLEEAASALDIFGELADHFAAFVDVISDVADSTLAASSARSTELIKLYERWLKTGSDRIAGALTERGIVPMRTAKGIH